MGRPSADTDIVEIDLDVWDRVRVMSVKPALATVATMSKHPTSARTRRRGDRQLSSGAAPFS